MNTIEQILLNKGADVITSLPTATVRAAAGRMDEANVGCLLVEEEARIIGIVTERDLVRRVLAASRDPENTLVSEVMSAPVRTCKPSDDIRRCAKIMAVEHIRHVAIVDDNGEAAGLISLRDILAAMGGGP